MPDLVDSNSTTEVPFARSNGVSSGEELQNIQAAYQFNGKNYLNRSQLIWTFLKGKGRLSHLLGTGPKEGDPMHAAWDEEDSLVMS